MRYLFISALLASTFLFAQTDNTNPKGYPTSGIDNIVENENFTIPQQHQKFEFNEDTKSKQGVYDYHYEADAQGDGFDGNLSKRNPFLYGHFRNIYRYAPLTFADSDSFDEKGEETFEKIMQQLQTLNEDPKNEYIISILGHTREVDNEKENIDLGSGYTDFFQAIAQYDRMDENASQEKGTNYAKYVFDKFVLNDIAEGYLYQENVEGSDPLYSENDEDARELNHRVDVAIYVRKYIDPDTDGDGVRDSKDYCPGTVKGARVDINGCPYVVTLHLQFSFDNDVFEDEKSYEDVMKLAKFMNKYPVYSATIVGHTDSQGAANYNVKLSERRAKIVLDTLVSKGISPSRLSSIGRGESEPIAKNDTKEGRFDNRRTEVELFLPKKKKKRHIKLRKRGE